MTDWKWVLDDDPSDLSGGAAFNRRLLFYPEAQASLVVNVPGASSITGHYYSALNQPGADVWRAGADEDIWQAKVYVETGLANTTLKLTLARIAFDGTFIQTYSTTSDPISVASAGPKNFGGLTLPQTTAPLPSSSDRLRLALLFTKTSAGAGDVTLRTGDPSNAYLQVPIVMGNPQMVWNGNTLAFPGPPTLYDWRLRSDRDVTVSGGRVSATGHRISYDEVRIQLANFEDEAFAAALRAWWAWARRGKQYSFAFDSADVVDLVLNGAAAAGQADIPLANTSSVVVGRRYLLREVQGEEEETIKVASVVTNVKAVADANLKYGYLTGDIFRSLDYFPKMVSQDSDLPLTRALTTFTLDHLMAEDRG